MVAFDRAGLLGQFVFGIDPRPPDKRVLLASAVARRTLQTKWLSYIQPSCYIFGQFFEPVGNRKISSDIFAASDGVNFATSQSASCVNHRLSRR